MPRVSPATRPPTRPIHEKSATGIARAFQHEIDPWNGILFIDRMNAVAKVSMRRKRVRLMEK